MEPDGLLFVDDSGSNLGVSSALDDTSELCKPELLSSLLDSRLTGIAGLG
jgi:hypothetical protein